MKIGIIGSGHIGSTAARLFIAAGHEIAISNARGPQSMSSLINELGPKARAVSVEEAEQFGDVVLVAIPLKAYKDLPTAPLKGKIVIDAMNYYPGRDGNIAELDSHQTTSSELFARHLPGARVVKAFNTMEAQNLASKGNKDASDEQRYTLYVASDDQQAKQTVIQLIEQLGFVGVDAGKLSDSRLQQPGSAVYTKLITGAEAKKKLQPAA